MKKLFTLTFCALSVVGCKTQVEKDISLKSLLNDPLHTETALLNVEVSACGDHEDSRKPSSSLLEAQNQVPKIFPQAKYKECFNKKFNSFASFEIPVGVGVMNDGDKPENDINIYSFKKRPLNVRTSENLSKNINNHLKKSYQSNFDFEIIINLKNDTGEDHRFNAYSVYWDGAPFSVAYPVLKNNETVKLKLGNVSSDMLWMFERDMFTPVLSNYFNLDDAMQTIN